MTKRQKLSSLSIAAAAFLAASVPCFAQAQSVESQEESSQVAMTVAEPTIALNREGANAESLPASDYTTPKSTAVTAKANQPSFSKAMFKQSMSQFSSSESQRFVTPQATIYDRVDNLKKQFRADDSAETAQRPRVSFNPSLGQKLPD